MKFRIVCIVLMLLLSTAIVAWAEIYKWKDSKGNIIFSDSPPAGSNAEKQIIREQRIERPAVQEEAPRSKGTATVKKRAYGDIRVIMYMTSWCPYCKQAKDYINSLGVRLTEYDIEKDKDKDAEMLRKSGGGKGVPLIDIEGSIIRGYSPSDIKAVIEEKRNL